MTTYRMTQATFDEFCKWVDETAPIENAKESGAPWASVYLGARMKGLTMMQFSEHYADSCRLMIKAWLAGVSSPQHSEQRLSRKLDDLSTIAGGGMTAAQRAELAEAIFTTPKSDYQRWLEGDDKDEHQ